MSIVEDRLDQDHVAMAKPPTIDELYRTQWASLVRLALVMTGDRGRAEDLVHDVFLRFAARPLPLDPPTYLRRMVINAARDHHRRIKVERRFAPTAPLAVFNPEVDEVIELLKRLPDRQRHAIALRYYADMDVAQIAQALDCPTGTVKSLLHRGIEGLRKEMHS
ncbi:MAG TPA: sigma-70 family RNA polymerase sigma factor [Acidimicrobiales bacterium]|jgi:RNA polymerase sigma factor (sigma-70 family)|nr:sigma-70 family RNA polymerase sigma factor [Acidimicrobiales bacterium]